MVSQRIYDISWARSGPWRWAPDFPHSTMCAIHLLLHKAGFQLNGFFLALQCRLECEPGYVAQRTPLITCVNGEYAKGCHYLQKLITNSVNTIFPLSFNLPYGRFLWPKWMNFWKYSQTNAIFNPKYDIAIFWFSTWPLNHNFFGNILEFLRILRFLKKYQEKCIKHEPFGN